MTTLIEIIKGSSDIAALQHKVAEIYKEASDIVASDVVREGYQASGHPAALSFQHLNVMAKSRIKKRYPFFDLRTQLSKALWAQGRLIVARGIANKYKARLAGDWNYDYIKEIDTGFDDLFATIEGCRTELQKLSAGGAV